MTSQEILNEIQKLPIIEQKEIAASLQKILSADSMELKLQKILFENGLLREIKPHRVNDLGSFKPVEIQGKPISETILEERR